MTARWSSRFDLSAPVGRWPVSVAQSGPMHTGGVTPTVARRLLYGIVAACLAVTAGIMLLRPAPQAATVLRHAPVIDTGLPDVAPQQFFVPADGPPGESYRVDANGSVEIVQVHGLPGHIAASP
jgi:hypothetical protein